MRSDDDALTYRDPVRLDVNARGWTDLSPQEKDEHFRAADRELDEVGILVIANALTHAECDEFYAIISEQAHTSWAIEQALFKEAPVHKVYDFQSRHPKAMELINLYTRGYVRQRWDLTRGIPIAQLKGLSEDQKTLLGYRHRAMRDVSELYFIKPTVGEFDPLYGKEDRTSRWD
jgi:hypothetical protein